MSRMETLEDLDIAIERSLRALFQGHPNTEDYIQEARVAVWQRLEDSPDTPLGMLLTIARNKAIDAARGKSQFGAPKRSPGSGSRRPTFASWEAVAPLLGEPSADPFPAADGAFLVDDLLALLDDEERTIVTMAMDGWSQREMAAELGVSQAWITRRRLPNVRRKLAAFLPDLRMA